MAFTQKYMAGDEWRGEALFTVNPRAIFCWFIAPDLDECLIISGLDVCFSPKSGRMLGKILGACPKMSCFFHGQAL